jgi:hypothetical protein
VRVPTGYAVPPEGITAVGDGPQRGPAINFYVVQVAGTPEEVQRLLALPQVVQLDLGVGRLAGSSPAEVTVRCRADRTSTPRLVLRCLLDKVLKSGRLAALGPQQRPEVPAGFRPARR